MTYFNSLLLTLCALYGCGGSGGESVTSVTPPLVVVPPPVSTNPEYGTLLRSGCSQDYEGVKWFQYADGEGGTYSEKDTKSVECGYKVTLTLLLEEEVGDKFYPVVVKVEYVDTRGEDQVWGMEDASTTIGVTERIDYDTVLIYGDGRLGDGIFTLGREEILFTMVEEPVCVSVFSNGGYLDCQGYTQRTNQDLIYYGEEDELVITWELAVLIYTRGDTVEIIDDATMDQWEKWEKRVEEYNEVYERSGIHIRYELSELKQATFTTLGDLQYLRSQLDVDIVLGHGISYPDTCGVARVTTYFRNKPPVSLSRCDIYTDLHELGHSVGLAHGPENQYNEARGYIFPEFGHGWNNICSRYDDLMSYGYEGFFHTNETLFCEDIFPNVAEGFMAGNRQYTDTAYHLNRVRYNVSLIHDENKYIEEEQDGPVALDFIKVEAQYSEIEVID